MDFLTSIDTWPEVFGLAIVAAAIVAIVWIMRR